MVDMSVDRADHERYQRLDAAFRRGDVAALRAELGDPDGFPNLLAHPAMGTCGTYAIYHSPIDAIRTLLELGGNPNAPADDGFPPLIAAITCLGSGPGSPARPDAHPVIE